jgi:hypothetical protein
MQDNIFFARFEAVEPVTSGKDGDQLRQLLNGTQDVPIIMSTMKEAIKRMAAASVGKPLP